MEKPRTSHHPAELNLHHPGADRMGGSCYLTCNSRSEPWPWTSSSSELVWLEYTPILLESSHSSHGSGSSGMGVEHGRGSGDGQRVVVVKPRSPVRVTREQPDGGSLASVSVAREPNGRLHLHRHSRMSVWWVSLSLSARTACSELLFCPGCDYLSLVSVARLYPVSLGTAMGLRRVASGALEVGVDGHHQLVYLWVNGRGSERESVDRVQLVGLNLQSNG